LPADLEYGEEEESGDRNAEDRARCMMGENGKKFREMILVGRRVYGRERPLMERWIEGRSSVVKCFGLPS